MKKLLTNIELDILNLTVQGFSDEEIAAKTGQDIDKIKEIISGLKEKLGASCRLQMIIQAIKSGLVE